MTPPTAPAPRLAACERRLDDLEASVETLENLLAEIVADSDRITATVDRCLRLLERLMLEHAPTNVQ